MTDSPAPSTQAAAVRARLLAWADQRRTGWPAEQRQRAQLLDAVLLSRQGIGIWLGLGGGLLGLASGLRASGASWLAALLITVVYGAALVLMTLRAWREPERYTGRRLARVAAFMVLATYASTLAYVWQRRQGEQAASWPEPQEWLPLIWAATPFQLMLGLITVLYVWLLSSARRKVLQAEVDRLQLVRERDQAARAAAEARLSLLQAQIRPHFIFNTLAALQHWVDTGDARAPELLRALTGFLRASTDLMTREHITLAEEAAMLRDYLRIQQARLGERLQTHIDLPAAANALLVPPGLLLTLVENALEHGISPALHGGELVVMAGMTAGMAADDAPHTAWLRVINSGQPLDAAAAEQATGVGLRNCRERLTRLHGARAQLTLTALADGRTEARAQWPLALENP